MKKLVTILCVMLTLASVISSCTSSRKVGCPMSGGQTARYRSYK